MARITPADRPATMRAVQRPEEEPGNQTKPGDDAGRAAAEVWVGSAEQITRPSTGTPPTAQESTNRGKMRAHKSAGCRASAAGVLALTVSAVLMVFGLTGCGANSNNATPSVASSATTASSGAQLDVGNTINYGSFGTTTDIDCGNGKSLNVGGSNNTLTVKGTCGSVTIGGADNKITLDKIDSQLHVVGLNNTITYKDGNPNVNNVGANNTINKG